MTRLIYADDSGSDQTGIAVFGWVELDISAWRTALRGWLDFRHELYAKVGLPADAELHATKFVNGRGRPTGTAWDEVKSHRRAVMAEALQTIASLPGLRTGAVFQRCPPGGRYSRTKADTYAKLVRWWDARLTTEADLGLIIMDGDGSDPHYRTAHRDLKLATRSVIEDPLFQGSHHSQWVQMGDLVAYTAYMRVAAIQTKEHTWAWWTDILAATAVTGNEPLDLSKPA